MSFITAEVLGLNLRWNSYFYGSHYFLILAKQWFFFCSHFTNRHQHINSKQSSQLLQQCYTKHTILQADNTTHRQLQLYLSVCKQRNASLYDTTILLFACTVHVQWRFHVHSLRWANCRFKRISAVSRYYLWNSVLKYSTFSLLVLDRHSHDGNHVGNITVHH